MVTFLPGDPPPRLAFSVTRKVGPAVVRNRVRRQLRESFRRLTVDGTVAGGSYLLAARPEVIEHSFADLHADLRRALARAGAVA